MSCPEPGPPRWHTLAAASVINRRPDNGRKCRHSEDGDVDGAESRMGLTLGTARPAGHKACSEPSVPGGGGGGCHSF